ncbi:MAG: hypothetical protein SGI84_07350 [Gemmatimonadota bacterium]|nr:hypothetical protein [Gemmatimonadota bacterium]
MNRSIEVIWLMSGGVAVAGWATPIPPPAGAGDEGPATFQTIAPTATMMMAAATIQGPWTPPVDALAAPLGGPIAAPLAAAPQR